MSKLRAMLDKAKNKANDCSEAKLVAEFIDEMLEEVGDEPEQVADSMATLINWAIDFKQAAEAR